MKRTAIILFIAGCCGTTTPTVWKGQRMHVKADAGAQARWKVENAEAMLKELDAAEAKALALVPPEKRAEVKALRDKLVIRIYSNQYDCSGAAGTYDGNGGVCVSWFEKYVDERRLSRLPAHEFGHGVANILGIYGNESIHDWMKDVEWGY